MSNKRNYKKAKCCRYCASYRSNIFDTSFFCNRFRDSDIKPFDYCDYFCWSIEYTHEVGTDENS